MKWSEDRQKKLDFYNRYLRQENQASSDIGDIHQAAALYYQARGEKQARIQEKKEVSLKVCIL